MEASRLFCFFTIKSLQEVLHENRFRYKGRKAAYRVSDPYEYYVTPTKCFALLAYKLLKDDARRAKEIIAQNKPLLTKEAYLSILEASAVKSIWIWFRCQTLV